MSAGCMVGLYCGDKRVGSMEITAIPEDCKVSLKDGLSRAEVPIEFHRGYFFEGVRNFEGKSAGEFIRDRVEPRGRMNIGQVLSDMGLTEYDPIKMFLWHKGKCVLDRFNIW